MIIDISSYNGEIDFKELKTQPIEKIILRGTTKNGSLDTKFMTNINGILQEMPTTTIDVYKFTYATDYASAAVECTELIETLKFHGVAAAVFTIWLDIEPVNGREHTTRECSDIIAAYRHICRLYDFKFGIYCNYSYLKNKMPKWAQNIKFWVARWNTYLGDCKPFNVEIWQYTNKGIVEGIKGDVDISKVVQ